MIQIFYGIATPRVRLGARDDIKKMIEKLEKQDIAEVVKIHRARLSGILSELGEEFLKKFYRVSLSIPEMFTIIMRKNGHILGFATGVTSTKNLYKKIIFTDISGFAVILLKYFITHIFRIGKIFKIVMYPGFANDGPELLTIAVGKKWQKRGIGRELFRQITAEFERRGIDKFKISVYERLPANGFYKKMGCRLEKQFFFLEERMNYYGYGGD